MDSENYIDEFSRRRPQKEPEQIIEILSSDEECEQSHCTSSSNSLKTVPIKQEQEKVAINKPSNYYTVTNDSIRAIILPPEPEQHHITKTNSACARQFRSHENLGPELKQTHGHNHNETLKINRQAQKSVTNGSNPFNVVPINAKVVNDSPTRTVSTEILSLHFDGKLIETSPVREYTQ